MPDNVTINLPIPTLSSAVSAFSFCAAAATVSGRPGLTTGSNRSLRSLGRAKARPLAKRYTSEAIVFHLKDREFEIYEANMHGKFLENELHCYLEITTKEIEFEESNWAPSLSHQGLILKAKSLEDLDGLVSEWSSENNPHPEVGILSVFGHAQTNNNIITFGIASEQELNFSWSGTGDVMWDSEFGSDVQFNVSGKLKVTIV